MADDGAKSARQHSDARFFEYGCRIDRDLLDKIIVVAKKDFAADAIFEISTQRNSGVISSKITAESISELIDGLHKSTAAGDPNWIDNLSIWVHGGFGKDPQKQEVSITIKPAYVAVSVSGSDAGWVRGRVGELRDLVAYSKARWVFSLPTHRAIIGASFFLYLVLAGIFIALQFATHKPIYTIAVLILLALYVAAAYANWKLSRRRNNQITILATPPPDRKDRVAIWMLIATVLTLIATVVGVVVAAVH